MLNIASYPYTECPAKKCRNTSHGSRITEAIQRSRASDEILAKYVAKSCRCFASVIGADGNGALHAAAGAGRLVVVEWLLNHGANVNLRTKDAQTAMHFALKFSHFNVAVLLQQYGADLDVVDQHFRHPLNYCQDVFNDVRSTALETLVWGSNKNYNLGLGNVEGRSLPQQLEFFNKLQTSITSVAISPYHCLYVNEHRQVYAVGHGNESQLGVGKKCTLVVPQQVTLILRKQDYVQHVSASRHHSLVLTAKGHVYSCGSNVYCKLGQQTNKQTMFWEVKFDGNNLPFQGIIATEYHSIAYNVADLYVWGTNVGQFGPKSLMPRILEPYKMVTYGHGICLVASSEAAIATYTASRIIMLFHNQKVRTLKTPTHEAIVELLLVGGEIDLDEEFIVGHNKPVSEPLKLMVRTESGLIFIWLDELKQYLKCDISLSKDAKCSQLLLVGNQITYVADGLVFTGLLVMNDVMQMRCLDPTAYQQSKQDFLCTNKEFLVDAKRVPLLNAVSSVACDLEGKSFIALQHSSRRFIKVPDVNKETVTFKPLLVEANEDDGVCDIVFHVEDDVYCAHKYLIYSRAPGLCKLCGDEKHVYLEIEHLSSKMFETVLKFVYNNHVLTMNDFEDIEISLSPFSGLDNLEVYSKFRELCGQFGVAAYATISLSSNPSNLPAIKLNRQDYPELHDVTIYCANKQHLKAHKCVLIARMEYFRMMFTSNWAESKTVNMRTIPIEYIEPLIDYLYDNDANALRTRNYSDNFIYNMLIICDQFFVNHLAAIFERMLIDRLTIKKCAELYEFACDYNRTVLQQVSLMFMVANVVRMLEHGLLMKLGGDIVDKITQKYREQLGERLQKMDNDVDSDWDAWLESSVLDFQVDLYHRSEAKQGRKKERKTSDSQQERRQLEKDAIDAIKNLSVQEDEPSGSKRMSESPVTVEAMKVSETILAKADWMKVTDKKDVRRKVVLAGLKANDVLSSEAKDNEAFVSLNKLTNHKRNTSLDTNGSDDSVDDEFLDRSIPLAHFTPQKTPKLSQKQRKSLFSPVKGEPITTPPSSPVVEKAWATNAIASPADKTPEPQPSTSSFFDIKTPSPNPTFNTPRSRRSKKSSNSPDASGSQTSPNFLNILREEQREKNYFHKLKNKSLALTLLEERAIDDLKKFYNVENVYDERITVARTESMQPIMHFATWHNKK